MERYGDTTSQGAHAKALAELNAPGRFLTNCTVERAKAERRSLGWDRRPAAASHPPLRTVFCRTDLVDGLPEQQLNGGGDGFHGVASVTSQKFASKGVGASPGLNLRLQSS